MLAGTAFTATMFDVMAIAKYTGMPSLIGMSAGIALFIAAGVLMIKSKNDPIVDLSLLSLVSLVWAYHWPYDYFVLLIPLTYALKHWQQGTTDVADMLIVLGTFLIWFVQRLMDAAVSWFPEITFIAIARQVVFWVAFLAIYTTLVSYFIRGPRPGTLPRGSS
jgi:hypothetical protein